LCFQLSLIDELRGRVEHALESLASDKDPDPVAEIRLNVALGQLTQNTRTPQAVNTAATEKAIALAEKLGVTKYRVVALIGLASFYLGLGDYRAAVETADRARTLANEYGDALAILATERIAAQSYHFAGDHVVGRMLAERVLSHPAKTIPLAYSQLSVSRQVSMRIVLARVRWLQGFADQASRIADEAVAEAASDSSPALCQALALAACPVALWRGDDNAAGAYANRLVGEAARFTLGHWHSWGRCYQAVLAWRDGERPKAGDPSATVTIEASGSLQQDTLVTLVEGAIDPDGVLRAETGAAGWCAPEILRAGGVQHLRRADEESGEAMLLASLDLARKQGALSWELRTATNLAEFCQQRGGAGKALDVLAPVYNRFAEGLETKDLRRARELLTALGA
jgi:hypothetical protein